MVLAHMPENDFFTEHNQPGYRFWFICLYCLTILSNPSCVRHLHVVADVGGRHPIHRPLHPVAIPIIGERNRRPPAHGGQLVLGFISEVVGRPADRAPYHVAVGVMAVRVHRAQRDGHVRLVQGLIRAVGALRPVTQAHPHPYPLAYPGFFIIQGAQHRRTYIAKANFIH